MRTEEIVAQPVIDLVNAMGRAQGKQVVYLERRGPAFPIDGSAPREQARPDLVAIAIIRSGYEVALEHERQRELTADERLFCQRMADAAIRRLDDAHYEDDKSDAVGLTVEYFTGRRSFDVMPDWMVREVAQEAISIFRSVETRASFATVDGCEDTAVQA